MGLATLSYYSLTQYACLQVNTCHHGYPRIDQIQLYLSAKRAAPHIRRSGSAVIGENSVLNPMPPTVANHPDAQRLTLEKTALERRLH
ncbi:hypothetical protein N7522_005556 [Penicillium canescens]|nr:hypothetical protein N7522_005556 [Penicillium canescens]